MCVPLAKDFRGKESKQYQLNVVEFHQGKNLCYKFSHNYNCIIYKRISYFNVSFEHFDLFHCRWKEPSATVLYFWYALLN